MIDITSYVQNRGLNLLPNFRLVDGWVHFYSHPEFLGRKSEVYFRSNTFAEAMVVFFPTENRIYGHFIYNEEGEMVKNSLPTINTRNMCDEHILEVMSSYKEDLDLMFLD